MSRAPPGQPPPGAQESRPQHHPQGFDETFDTPEIRTSLNNIYASADIDYDGSLDAHEMQFAAFLLNHAMAKGLAAHLTANSDFNGDGSIDREEAEATRGRWCRVSS